MTNHTINDPFLGNIVRISAENTPKGTGFIIQSEDPNTVYVLTARHCLEKINPNTPVSIDFFDFTTNQFGGSFQSTSRFFFNAPSAYDIALIPLTRQGLPQVITNVQIYTAIPKGSVYTFIGFPESLQGKLPHEVTGWASISSGDCTTLKTLQDFENNETDSAKKTEGYSGSGVLIEAGGQTGLAGVITHFHSSNKDFTAFSLGKINSILQEAGSPPIQMSDPPQESKPAPTESGFSYFNQVLSNLELAEQYWINLQPQKALTLIEPLGSQVAKSTLSTIDQNSLLAKIEFIQAFAQLDLERPVDIDPIFIRVYKRQKDNKQYQERAVLAYYYQNLLSDALQLAEHILETDDENPRAWFVYHQFKPEFPVPLAVKERREYKMAVLPQLVHKDAREQTDLLIELFANELVEQKLPDQLDRYTIYYWYYVAQSAMAKAFRQADQMMSLSKPLAFRNSALLKYSRDLFQLISQTVGGTSFYQHIHFTNARFNYCIGDYFLTEDAQEERELTDELYKLFIGNQSTHRLTFLQAPSYTPIVESMPSRLLEVLTIFLQQDRPDYVINTLNLTIPDENPDAYFLLAQAHSMLDQTEKMVEAYRQFLASQTSIDALTASNCIVLIGALVKAKQPNEDIVRWVIEGKQFSEEYLEPLLTAYCLCTTKNKRETVKEAADLVYVHWALLKRPLRRALAIIYYTIQEWAIAKTLWKELIENPGTQSEDLRSYIISLNYDLTEVDELKQQFENWRILFAPDETLLNLELDHYRKLGNSEKQAEIALFGLTQFPHSFQFWQDAVYSLYKLENTDALVPLLDERILTAPLPTGTSFQIAKIYILNHRTDLGLDACFKTLKENWADPNVRAYYLSISTQFKSYLNFKKLEIAELNSVIQLSADGKSEWVELSTEALTFNPVAKASIGLSIGQTFSINKSMTGKVVTYQIDQILDKYEGQFVLILQHSSQHEHEGAPFQLFTFSDVNNPEAMLQDLESIVGPAQKEHYEVQEKLIQRFTDREIGFYELTQGAYLSNPRGAWEQITNDPQIGFPIFPIAVLAARLPAVTFHKDLSFVLDFSSLLTLHSLSICDQLCYRAKPFIVSQFTIDFIASELDKARTQEESTVSFGYEKNQFRPFFMPEDIQERRIEYWTSLKQWVTTNCQPDYVWERLKLQKAQPEIDRLFSGTNLYHASFFDTLLLTVDKKDRILITDDLYHFTKLPLNYGLRVTTEWFLKKVHDAQFADLLWLELVKLNMKGLSLTGNQLFQTYTSEPKIDSPNSLYQKAVQSFAIQYNPAVNSILELINFMKRLFLMKMTLPNNESTAIKLEITRELMKVVFAQAEPIIPATISLINKQIDYELASLNGVSTFVKNEFKKNIRVMNK